MKDLNSRRSIKTLHIKLLCMALVFGLVLGCGGRRRRKGEPDPVDLAEKTRPERAVSEHGGDDPSAVDPDAWRGVLEEAKDLDYVLVEIEGDSITWGEALVLADERARRMRQPVSLKMRKLIFREIVQRLIARKLILAEAKELGYNESISDSRVLKYIRSKVPAINKTYNGDIEKFVEANNLDYNRFLKDMKNNLIHEVYMVTNVTQEIVVSPREIREYYEKNKDKFHEKAQVHMYAMTLFKKADPQADAEVLAKANMILKKLDDGEDFEKLAREHTDDNEKREKDGEWGWIRRGDFASKEVPDAAFALKVGGHSRIIITKPAYWIVKVVGKKAEKAADIRDHWDSIRWAIWNEKRDKKRSEEIYRLQEKHKVIIHGSWGVKE